MSIKEITQEAFDALEQKVSSIEVNTVEEGATPSEGEADTSTASPSSKLSPKEFLNSTLGQHSPEDVFAGMLEIFQPRFDLILNKLSNNQLRRLIRALIKGALNSEKISDKVTKEAFFLGEKLLLAQMMLVAKGFSDKQSNEGEVNVGTESTVETTNGSEPVQG